MPFEPFEQMEDRLDQDGLAVRAGRVETGPAERRECRADRLDPVPSDEIERALKQPMERFSDETVTEPEAVRLLVKETARRGFSINQQGFEMGVISAAAPVLAPSGKPIGALAVAAPTARTTRARMLDIGQKTMTAAAGIAQKYYGAKP